MAFVCLLEIHLHFPDNGSPQGQAQGDHVAQGAAAAALRRRGRRDRPPRPLAARDAARLRSSARDAGAAGRCRGQARALTSSRTISATAYAFERGARRPATSSSGATRMRRRPHAAGQRGRAGGALRTPRRGPEGPRIGFVTVTAVDTSPDLRHARVYVSVLGDDAGARGDARRAALLARLAAGAHRARAAHEAHARRSSSSTTSRSSAGMRITELLDEVETSSDRDRARPGRSRSCARPTSSC